MRSAGEATKNLIELCEPWGKLKKAKQWRAKLAQNEAAEE